MARVDYFHVPFCSDLRDGVLYLSGELDGDSRCFLDAALQAAVRHTEGPLAIDMSLVTFCSSAGLACLIRAKLGAGDRPVVLTGVTPAMRRLLAIAAVEPLFELQPATP